MTNDDCMTTRSLLGASLRRALSVALAVAVASSAALVSAQAPGPSGPSALPPGVGPSMPSNVSPGSLSQMSGQPLFVNDLQPGTVTVRVVRGTMDAVVAQHRVELQGPGKMLVASTDEQGRAQFGPLPPGTLTQAFTTLDGQQLMSAAFPVPAEGGTRLLLAGAEHAAASSGASPLPLLSSTAEVPYGASPLAQMAGLPLQVGDLPPGTVSVRLLRGGFESPVVGHEVELHAAGRAQILRVKTDAAGRAVFPPQAVGAVVHARSVVDSEALESQAFPLPDRGGVRMILVAGAAQAPSVSHVASSANAPPAGSAWAAGSGVVGSNEPMPIEAGTGSLVRIVIALGCFAAAGAVVLMSRRGRRPHATGASDSVREG